MAAFGMPFDNREQNPPGYAPSHYLNRNLEDGKLYSLVPNDAVELGGLRPGYTLNISLILRECVD